MCQPEGQGLDPYEVRTGTSDTRRAVTLSEDSYPSVCPCGRSHAIRRRSRKRPGPADHDEMVGKVYEAKAEGKAIPGDRPGEWLVNYAGNCEAPMRMRRYADSGALLADYFVRCRRCKPCLRARMGFWVHHATRMAERTEAEGRRTWFGTLTLSPSAQRSTLDLALQKWLTETDLPSSAIPDWWDEPSCDYRFAIHRTALVREVQLYMKRLRKAGHQFKYFVVFERHKSGLPHIHWLLHETGDPIRKSALQAQWSLGFTQVKLVGGYCKKRKRKLSPVFAAHYVAKYLAKEFQSRQLVSINYKTPRP